MSGPFDVLLFLEAATVVLAGGLILYTTVGYRAMVLYPMVTALLGGAFVIAGVGTMLSVTAVPGGYTHTLGFVSLAGFGFCLAGWKLTRGLVDSEQLVGSDMVATETSGGFGPEQ